MLETRCHPDSPFLYLDYMRIIHNVFRFMCVLKIIMHRGSSTTSTRVHKKISAHFRYSLEPCPQKMPFFRITKGIRLMKSGIYRSAIPYVISNFLCTRLYYVYIINLYMAPQTGYFPTFFECRVHKNFVYSCVLVDTASLHIENSLVDALIFWPFFSKLMYKNVHFKQPKQPYSPFQTFLMTTKTTIWLL